MNLKESLLHAPSGVMRRRGLGLFLAAAVILAAMAQAADKGEGTPLTETPEFKKALEVPEGVALYRPLIPVALKLDQPQGLCFDSLNRLHVVGDKVWTVFEDFEPVRSTELREEPLCISVARDGAVFIGFNDHVQVFDTDGAMRARWPRLDAKSVVTSVAAGEDFVYVADAGKRLVWKCDRRGKVRGRLRQGALVVPSPYLDVALDGFGSLWVVNPGKHVLENLADNGVVRSSWGEGGLRADGFCGCCNPTHFALLPDGGFVTAEKGIVRVKVYGPDGKLRAFVLPPMRKPAVVDLAADRDGRVAAIFEKDRKVRLYEKANMATDDKEDE